MIFDNDAVLLDQALQHVARDPYLVGSLLRTLAENLKFLLALGHLGIDAFMLMPAARKRSRCFSTKWWVV